MDETPMKPGLYRVETKTFVAGFEITSAGEIGACAPILRRNILFWFKLARWIAPP
jgi:hypothetical protein